MALSGLASTNNSTVPQVGSYGAGLLGTVVRLNLAVSDVLSGITGAHGTNLADYLVLGVIRGAPGSKTSPGAIAETLGRTSGGMTLTLDRLVNAGWVRKSKDPSDGRRTVVELTDAGTELAIAVNQALHDWEHELSLEESADVVATLESLTWAVTRSQTVR